MKTLSRVLSSLITAIFLLNGAVQNAHAGDITPDEKAIRYAPNLPIEGKSVRLYAAASSSDARDYKGVIRFRYAGGDIGEAQTVSIVSTRSDDVFVDWAPPAGGTYIVTVVVEVPGDENPENNSFTFYLPVDYDTDNDGTGNSEDTDDDNDGLSDTEEQELGTDPLRSDTDGDGISDDDEENESSKPEVNRNIDDDTASPNSSQESGTNGDPSENENREETTNISDATQSREANEAASGSGNFAESAASPQNDSDNDGLSNNIEQLLGSNPARQESSAELSGIFSRLDASVLGIKITNTDTDEDGLPDELEALFGSDPLRKAGNDEKRKLFGELEAMVLGEKIEKSETGVNLISTLFLALFLTGSIWLIRKRVVKKSPKKKS